VSEAGWGAVIECPFKGTSVMGVKNRDRGDPLTESRYADDLRALAYQLSEGFWEGKVPAYQQSDFAKWCIEDFVLIPAGRGEVLPLRSPSRTI